jgi:hypothetical protein
VTVETNGHRQMQEVLSGGSYYSQSDFALHFGLGGAATMDRVEVRWPSGKTQSWRGLAAGRKYTLTEGEASPEGRNFVMPKKSE